MAGFRRERLGEPRGHLRLTCGVEFGLLAVGGWIDEYLRRNGLPAEPAELREHALIMFSPGGRRSAWELTLGPERETQRISGHARLRVNNSFAVRDAVLRDLGIGQLPLLGAAPAGTGERLVRVLPDWSGTPVPVHAIYPSNCCLAPKVRAFIDLALERLPQQTDAASRTPITTRLAATAGRPHHAMLRGSQS